VIAAQIVVEGVPSTTAKYTITCFLLHTRNRGPGVVPDWIKFHKDILQVSSKMGPTLPFIYIYINIERERVLHREALFMDMFMPLIAIPCPTPCTCI
jgi:hypothetical protein